MQIVSVPLFNEDMTVESYMFSFKGGNELFSTTQLAGAFDGASRSDLLQTLNFVGLDAFTLGKEIFVPINPLMVLNDLEKQCTEPPEKIIFLFEDPPLLTALHEYFLRMDTLGRMGFRFAMKDVPELWRYDLVLKYFSYFFLTQDPKYAERTKRIHTELRKNHREIQLVATDVQLVESVKDLRKTGYVQFHSRSFWAERTAGDTHISPLKMNSIRLINTVQDDGFDFDQVANIVQGDPSLAVSLLRIVNAKNFGKNKIKSINHAVAMMGQQEVRKWVTTAVSQSLGDDRPNEITKISLVRAKFAENLAPLFELAHMAQGLFLTGLFSVVDIILEVSMEKALEIVSVSDMIRNALLNQSGVYYPVLNMLVHYEHADWVEVSRLMIIHDIDMDMLSQAYIEAMTWYRDAVTAGDDDEDIDVTEAAK